MVGAIGLWLALEWYGATSEVAWLFLLAAWLLALVLATFVYAAWNRAGLRLHLAVKADLPEPGSPIEDLPVQLMRLAPGAAPLFEGDGVELEVGLDTSGSARGPAWVSGHVNGSPVMLATGVVPRAGWRQATVLTGLRRGVLAASGWSIGSSDPLGFFRGRRPRAVAKLGLVLPRFTSLSAHRPSREAESAVPAPRAGLGNELFGIREYRAGDSLRRIHWRSSARHGELVVREYEPPGVQAIGIVVDPAPPSIEIADQVARIAASEAWDCLREGGRVVIWAPGLEPTDSPRDLWGLLEWLARYPDLPEGAAPRNRSDIVVTADPGMLDGAATRNWLVGEAKAPGDIAFERVGTSWPL